MNQEELIEVLNKKIEKLNLENIIFKQQLKTNNKFGNFLIKEEINKFEKQNEEMEKFANNLIDENKNLEVLNKLSVEHLIEKILFLEKKIEDLGENPDQEDSIYVINLKKALSQVFDQNDELRKRCEMCYFS